MVSLCTEICHLNSLCSINSSFSIGVIFVYFVYLTAISKTSSSILSKKDNSDQHCFILKETIYPNLVWDWLFVFICNLIILSYVLVTALLLRDSLFLYKWRLSLVSFYLFIKMMINILSLSVNIFYHIYWYIHCEPSLNVRNEFHLVSFMSA